MVNKSRQFIVSAAFAKERLQNFLKKQFGDRLSGKEIKSLIDGYHCRVNGKIELFSSYRLRTGDKVDLEFVIEAKKEPSFHLLYEEEGFLIGEKGVATPSEEEFLRKLLNRNDLYLVHRLDKDTTGLLILAKTTQWKKLFEELFKDQNIKKIYHAICEGVTSRESFFKENYLDKVSSYEGQAIWGEVLCGNKGRYAMTQFRMLKKGKKQTLIKAVPVTGRTHQIRVHLSQSGLPILGDKHYARTKSFSYAAPRPFLHAHSLHFVHPLTKKELFFTSPYPEDFKKACEEIF